MADKYRKKPVVIEAMEWDGTATCATPIIDWILTGPLTASYHEHLLNTLEGVMIASTGDFIIKGVNGEFYPCKPDIFAKTYEAV